jgi:hypothetical protein
MTTKGKTVHLLIKKRAEDAAQQSSMTKPWFSTPSTTKKEKVKQAFKV